MTQFQEMAVVWLSGLASMLPLGYAFGAGMLAAVNPCGFAMLPAYLSLYLGVDDGPAAQPNVLRRLGRAVLVGGTVSSGFVLLFAAVGLIISAGGYALVNAMPWLGALMGVVMIVLGFLLLLGRTVSPATFERIAASLSTSPQRSIRGFFLFGLAYGIASLGCTLPVFLVAVGGALTGAGPVQGLTRFILYSLGMATIIVSLTVTLSLFKAGLVGLLRRAMPYVHSAAAVLVLLAGFWIVFYWSDQLLG